MADDVPLRWAEAPDGLTPARVLVLHAYYALRLTHPADAIGTPEITAWLRGLTPRPEIPCGTLVRDTLRAGGVPHRTDGRPRGRGHAPFVEAAPLLPVRRTPPHPHGSRPK